MNKRITTEIIINAPKETVWNVLTDFEAYPQWNPFILSVKGKAVKGERLTNTLRNGDKTMVFKPKVLSVVPFQYFDWLGSLGFRGLFDGHHSFEIEEVSPTQVKLKHSETFSGLLSSAILKKIGEPTRQNFIRMNQALKERAESNRQHQ